MSRSLRAGMFAAALTVVPASCGQAPQTSGGPRPTTSTTTTTTTTVPPSTSTTVRPPTTVTTAPPAPPTTSPAGPAALIAKGNTNRMVVALTFDAGSDAGSTAEVLRILAANHIHATFGVTGVWARNNPALVQQIAAAGHQIVNHSWDHRSFTGYSTKTTALTPTQITRELADTDALIRRLTGHGTGGWFRPPYGDRSANVDRVAGAAGYRYDLMWTVDTLGWEGVSTETVVQRSLASAAAGEIILMHVGAASTDAAALPAVIAALGARGYSFATVESIV